MTKIFTGIRQVYTQAHKRKNHSTTLMLNSPSLQLHHCMPREADNQYRGDRMGKETECGPDEKFLSQLSVAVTGDGN